MLAAALLARGGSAGEPGYLGARFRVWAQIRLGTGLLGLRVVVVPEAVPHVGFLVCCDTLNARCRAPRLMADG